MQDNVAIKFNALVDNLQQIIKVYRGLLDNLRKEKEILIAADLADLNDNNVAKEKLLVSVGKKEQHRIVLAKELAVEINFKDDEPKLLGLAIELGGEAGDKLRNLHSVLLLLLKRVKETNEHNEILVQSALNNVNGAMNSIVDTVSEKPTYENKGQIQQQSLQSGKLVSREV